MIAIYRLIVLTLGFALHDFAYKLKVVTLLIKWFRNNNVIGSAITVTRCSTLSLITAAIDCSIIPADFV